MPSRTRRFRPFLALLLALTMVPTGAADASVTTRTTDAPIAIAPAAAALPTDAAKAVVTAPARNDPGDGDRTPAPDSTVRTTAATRVAIATPAPKAKHVLKAASKAPKASKASSSTKGAATTHHGRNHLWIPALGISRSTTFYSCSSGAYPGNRVYRWGCGGRNNVYLFGHAYSVFKPLHDAYVRGHLRKGMKLFYANGAGKVSTYKVIWWRLTSPTNGAFAFASQSRPSVTLQTCIGAKSQWRLIVRLVKV